MIEITALQDENFYLYKRIDGKISIYGEGSPDPLVILQRQNAMKRSSSCKGIKFMKGAELKAKYAPKPPKETKRKKKVVEAVVEAEAATAEA